MNNYYRWYDGNLFQYASSLAATWIWAPALLISSAQAYNNGIAGFLMFLIPNTLTMFLFSLVIKRIRESKEGYTLIDGFKNASQRQQKIHLFVSCVILLMSVCVQIVGISTALEYLIPNKYFNCIFISLIALLLVWRNGLKASIITDSYKYIILFICAAVICIASTNSETLANISWVGHKGLSTMEIWMTFGITAGMGLLSSPYSDSTMWQRAWSIQPENLVKTFGLASFLFMLIPLMFGYVGFLGMHNYTGVLQHVMLVAILCALVSTLDSNLISIASFAKNEFKFSDNISRIIMVIALSFACFVFLFDIFNITQAFLSYNTIRACIVLPSLMIIFNKFNEKRLFYVTLLSCTICPIGYFLTFDFRFTVIGFLITLLGFQMNKEKA